MSGRLERILGSYAGTASVVDTFPRPAHGPLRIIEFGGVTPRGFGYDLWVGDQRVEAGMRDRSIALYVAANFAPAARPS